MEHFSLQCWIPHPAGFFSSANRVTISTAQHLHCRWYREAFCFIMSKSGDFALGFENSLCPWCLVIFGRQK